jgi:ERCC4-type nuclease
MEIVLDNREKHSRIENAKKYYENLGDIVSVKELPFGDYIFENKVVFEYKTLSDFIQSVKSGRVFNQAIDQSTVFPYHFVIVVSSIGERKVYFKKLRFTGNPNLYFDEKKFIGAISRLNTFTTVLQANNETEAFMFMRSQARKCLDNKQIVKRLETKTDNPAFNFLMNIKHISDTKAKLIVENLDLYSLEDLLNVTNNDLQGIKGIGSQTSGIIMKALK